jgi:hypothetical protein
MLWITLFACSSSKSTLDTSDSALVDTNDTDDTQDTNDSGSFPEDPGPFSIDLSGVYTQTLVFDEPSCLKPAGSSNLRIFWRNSQDQHVFVLKLELLGNYTGVGTYETNEARATLQEEAGGSGLYFTANTDLGDMVDLQILGDEDGHIWGEGNTPSMHDVNEAEIIFSPSLVPVWCDEVTE